MSVSLDGVAPRAAAEALGRQGIYVWDGDFYATGLIERLGKAETGGVLRLGLVHYNTAEEVDRTLEAVEQSPRRRRVSEPRSIQARLARGFDPAELRRIKRLWVRHSIAEDRRDVDGLIATLSPDCTYEIVVTGQRWEGHDGARRFYAELFAAFPDNAFALSEIVVGPQGVFEVATLTGTNQGRGPACRRPAWRSPWRSSSSSPGTPPRSGSPGSGSGSTAALASSAPP